jgi:hypothetical protein
MEKQYLFTTREAVKAIDKEKLTITHIINTKVLDRHGTVVLPNGVDVKSYMKNPVVLAIHDGHQLPIGKCVDLKVSDDKIEATTLFNANDPVSMRFFKAFEDGFLNAWSIGFIPKGYKRVDEENMADLNTKHGLSITEEQIKDAGIWGLYLIYEWEMLEYSAVPIPANPEALNELVTRGFAEKDVKVNSSDDFRKDLTEKILAKEALAVPAATEIPAAPATLEAPVALEVKEVVSKETVDKMVGELNSAKEVIETLTIENGKINEKVAKLEETLATIQKSFEILVLKADFDKAMEAKNLEVKEIKDGLATTKAVIDEVNKSNSLNNIETVRDIEANKQTEKSKTTGSWVKNLVNNRAL